MTDSDAVRLRIQLLELAYKILNNEYMSAPGTKLPPNEGQMIKVAETLSRFVAV
jgi:hypothetical protein